MPFSLVGVSVVRVTFLVDSEVVSMLSISCLYASEDMDGLSAGHDCELCFACSLLMVSHGGAVSSGELGGGKLNSTYGTVIYAVCMSKFDDATATPELKGVDLTLTSCCAVFGSCAADRTDLLILTTDSSGLGILLERVACPVDSTR